MKRQVIVAVAVAASVSASLVGMVVRLPRELQASEEVRLDKLAAEQFKSADRTNDTRLLFVALGTADHALRVDPTLADALFLRAEILDRIGLSAHTAKAYENYLKVDKTSHRAAVALQRARAAPPPKPAPWHSDMRQLRAAALAGDAAGVAAIVQRFPSEARRLESFALGMWARATKQNTSAEAELTVAREIATAVATEYGDRLSSDAIAAIDVAVRAADQERIRLLAEGHDLYASRVFRDWHGATAQTRLEKAATAFRLAHSPMQWAAEFERAKRQWMTPMREGCNAIGDLATKTPTAYRELIGRIYHRQSQCLATSGDYAAALETGKHAIAIQEAIKDYDQAIYTSLHQGRMLYELGDLEALWRLRRQTLAWAGSSNSHWLNTELAAIAREAVSERSWEVARSAASLVIDSGSTLLPDTRQRIDAYISRAVAQWNQGATTHAQRDLKQARLSMHTDPKLREFDRRQIEGAELALMRQTNPSLELLEKSFTNALESRDRAQICDGHLQRAREYRRLNKHREAQEEFSRAFRILSQSPAAFASERLIDYSPGLSSDIHMDLVELLDSRGESADAFAVSERGRGRKLLQRMGYDRPPLTVDVVRKTLPANTLIVSFVTLRDRIVIFSIDQGSARVSRVRINRLELQARVDALTSIIAARGQWRRIAASLYQTLFSAVYPSIDRYDTIVIVPDAMLEHVPFSALINPVTRRLLLEQSSVVIAPSASVYVGISARPAAERHETLIVGDPNFNGAKYPWLERLPAAAREVTQIAALYQATALVGDTARTTTLLELMANADVIHIGAHTLLNATDPMLSSILMADGEIRVRDIALGRVREGSVAVLAGCRTATRTGKSDINSLALAFLAAGSRAAVGSLWNVDDAPTRKFSVRLHELLRAGVPVSQAVRRVQLEMLRSGDSSLSDVRSWAAFQVYGGH